MFRKILILLLVIVFVPSLLTALPKGVTKETLTVSGSERTYFLFIPAGLDRAKPAPAILLLHGSGRDGLSLVAKWLKLAKKEGVSKSLPAHDSFTVAGELMVGKTGIFPIE
ncbi:MAG: hypothetical protein GY950_07410 [bacterium]|nr:hypothetical protein [bacterium]